MLAHLETLQREVAECELVSRSAAGLSKREFFAKLARQVDVLAKEVECEILRQKARGASTARRSDVGRRRPQTGTRHQLAQGKPSGRSTPD